MPPTTPIIYELTQPAIPNEAIVETYALHELCEVCQGIFKDWQPLNRFLSSEEQLPPEQSFTSFLRNVAQLAESSACCHLCKSIFASLERRPFLKLSDIMDRDIWLRIGPRGKDALALYAVFSSEEPKSEGQEGYSISFTLEKYHVSDKVGFNEHIMAREVPVHARDNLARARCWLETCIEEHNDCRSFQFNTVDTYERPTRILEIIGESNVRLRCDMASTHYDYLALSHMWGEKHKDQIRLLEHNLRDFQDNVPWLELSTIYREAVRITLELGHRYLWIDSLCIIQDSTKDWDEESQRMAIVYGNCICNIAYLFPPDSSPQIRDDPRIWSPCILRPATATQPGAYVHHLVHSWRRVFPDEYQDWLVQRHWPLFSRAWTFQEYLLSPRTLLYGHKNLMFQCSRVFYDELLGPIAEKSKTSKNDRGRDLSKSRYFPAARLDGLRGDWSNPASYDFILNWSDVIHEYRTRDLSFPIDRIIAFAGTATANHTLYSLTYLAGLWLELMPACLLWFVERKLPALVRGHYPEYKKGEDVPYTEEVLEETVHNAPSWCWFSIPIYKFYRTSFLLGDPEPGEKARSEREPDRSNWTDLYCAKAVGYTFQGYEHNEFPKPQAFVNFSGLQLTLDTLTWPVRRPLPPELAACIQDFDEDATWEPTFKYHPDVPTSSLDPTSPPRRGMFALIVEFQIVRTAGIYVVQRRLAGLVLMPAERVDTWRRVGVWYLKMRIKPGSLGKAHVSETAKTWMKCSLTSSWDEKQLVLV